MPGGAALTGPTGAVWCGICPVALSLTGPTGRGCIAFVGRVSDSATRHLSGQRQIRKYRSKRFARLTLYRLQRERQRGRFNFPQHLCRCRYHP